MRVIAFLVIESVHRWEELSFVVGDIFLVIGVTPTKSALLPFCGPPDFLEGTFIPWETGLSRTMSETAQGIPDYPWGP